ncbi:RNA polymerase sigma factor [Pseudonocardia sp. CA-107938]|uniref:RNA polymerase sigma factor n=1 Tax=Pseudonocardia sp. CA-107938 TaxID=3240021 RepID=UPI003D93365E
MTDVDLATLRSGDEAAFLRLVSTHHSALVRLALVYASSREVAEECVQETWIAVLHGIDRFEGRSSLRTWICRILINIVRRRAADERRELPFSSFTDDAGPTVDPDRFFRSGPNAGHWAVPPVALPEQEALSGELRTVVADAIAALPETQRTVVTLRDVEGWAADEVSALLEITPGNQRVLLHRARSRVRAALERYLDRVPARDL